MSEKKYSKEIAQAITEFLEIDDWSYSFNEKKGIFIFTLRLSLSSKIKQVCYILEVRQKDFIVYGYSPVGVDRNDKKKKSAMAEFICRANYGLKNGCFEMNWRTGDIRCKSYVYCGTTIPSYEIIENSIYYVGGLYNSYGLSIANIIFTDTDILPEDSVETCENSCSKSDEGKEVTDNNDNVDTTEEIS